MKVIAYSFWQKPEIYTVKSKRGAKVILRRIREEQKKGEVLTEREFVEREFVQF